MMVDMTEHAVVGVFQDVEAARRALDALRRSGIDPSAVSFLWRDGEEARHAVGVDPDEVPTAMEEVAEGTAGGALMGAAAGGALGLGVIAGVLAFGIPGIGPVLGTGLWAALGAGVAGGATVGLMVGGMRKMWELAYRDAVNEGRALVSVHSDDPDVVERAEAVLRRMDPARLDHFDEGGEVVHEHVELGGKGGALR